MAEKPIIIATRGSALALAQANLVADACRAEFPQLRCELKIIKTTGDKMQTASLANPGGTLPKGLFTKELEMALLAGEADLAVHSLKDLPTELPDGLILAATLKREDARDVLVRRPSNFFTDPASRLTKIPGFDSHPTLKDFPHGATFATSSTRRKMSLLAVRPDLHIVEIRGNVATRLQKIAEHGEWDATVLALAGMARLGFKIDSDGSLSGEGVPTGLMATILSLDEMLPCVGQGAIGIETRADDERIGKILAQINHADTFEAVAAERSFLRGMGGGCQSPVGAHAEISGGTVWLRAVSFQDKLVKRAEGRRPVNEATALGLQIAAQLK